MRVGLARHGDVLRAWDQLARSQGRPDNWRLPDQVLQASMQAFQTGLCAGQDLWVFAYGSLMWNPGFHFAEVRLATLAGFQRCFSFKIDMGRGTVDCPALMLSLENQPGCCTGLAFRITADQRHDELAILWRREMLQGSYLPAMLPVTTPQGCLTALVFAANPSSSHYVGPQPLDEAARTIATASGFGGSNRQYLQQLAEQLVHLGIDDDYVSLLLARVNQITARV